MKSAKVLIREDLKDLKNMLKKANETGLPQLGLTGNPIANGTRIYLSTVQAPMGFVWHIFYSKN